MTLHALVGNQETVCTLAFAARAEAAYRGFSHVGAIIANDLPTNTALGRAGFRRIGGMFIYERASR